MSSPTGACRRCSRSRRRPTFPPPACESMRTVLGATAVIAVVTGLLFGLAPALSLARQDLVEAFKDDGARSSGSRRSGWLRRVLVTAEVALCMLLLVGAGLLLQTFVRLRAVDPGFRPARRADRAHVAAGRALCHARGADAVLRRGPGADPQSSGRSRRRGRQRRAARARAQPERRRARRPREDRGRADRLALCDARLFRRHGHPDRRRPRRSPKRIAPARLQSPSSARSSPGDSSRAHRRSAATSASTTPTAPSRSSASRAISKREGCGCGRCR